MLRGAHPPYRRRNVFEAAIHTKPGASGIHEPPSGGPHIGGALATPIAALSGSIHKAPGSAGGYLLVSPQPGHEVVTETRLCLRTSTSDIQYRGYTLTAVEHSPGWRVHISSGATYAQSGSVRESSSGCRLPALKLKKSHRLSVNLVSGFARFLRWGLPQ